MMESNKDKSNACWILINHFEWLMWEQMKTCFNVANGFEDKGKLQFTIRNLKNAKKLTIIDV